MKNKRHFLVLLMFFAFVSIGIFSFQQPRQRNLKVLPKDISRDSLHQLMDSYNVALGVKCNFCHAARTYDATKLDFSSDSNHTKDEARYMMTMTNELNAKYFHDTKMDSTKSQAQMVTCMTCHNGKELPAR